MSFLRSHQPTRRAGTILALAVVTLVLVATVPMVGVLAPLDGAHDGMAVAQTDEQPGSETDTPSASDSDADDDSSGDGDGDGDSDAESDSESVGPSPLSDQSEAEDAREEMMEDGSSSDGGVGGNAGGASSEQVQEDQAAAEDAREEMQEGNTTSDGGVGGNAGGEPSAQTQEDQAAAEQSREDMVGDDPSGGAGYGARDDDGGVGFVAQQMLDMIEGLTAQASQEFGQAMEILSDYGVTRAAPGIAELTMEGVESWTNPEDPLWQGSFDGMSITRGIGAALVVVAAWWAFTTYPLNPQRSKSTFVICAFSTLFLLKPAFWTALSIHATNAFSLAIAPGEEAFSTPEGILLVLSTALLAGLMAAGSLWIVALAIVVTVFAHNATHLTMALLPLAAGLYPLPMYFRSVGEMIVYLHLATLATSPLQAIGSFITTRMFFAGAEAGVLESLAGVFAFLGITYIAFYKVPKEIFEKAFDAPITSLGVHGAKMSFEGARNTKTTIQNAPEMFKDIKANIDGKIEGAKSVVGNSDPAPSLPSVGRVQASNSPTATADGGHDAGKTPDAKSWGARPVDRGPDGRFQSIDTQRERDRIGRGDY